MTELMRPALYGAFHRIEPVRPAAGAPRHYEIVGPVCESSDVVGRDRELPPLAVGDLLAIRDAGAYGAAMASNYNRRPLPAEVLVDEGRWRVIRRRQTVDDMLVAGAVMCGSADRVRRARPERQADAGRAAARSPEGRRPQGAAGVVSRLRHLDRRGDRARAAGRARVRRRRHAAALRRQPLRAEARPPALARRRPGAGVRSLPGLERRLRRGVRARPGLAARHAEVPAARRR